MVAEKRSRAAPEAGPATPWPVIEERGVRSRDGGTGLLLPQHLFAVVLLWGCARRGAAGLDWLACDGPSPIGVLLRSRPPRGQLSRLARAVAGLGPGPAHECARYPAPASDLASTPPVTPRWRSAGRALAGAQAPRLRRPKQHVARGSRGDRGARDGTPLASRAPS